MKTILMHQPGPAEVLQYATAPLPELPSASHVRVRLQAVGVNPVDTKLRKGGTYFPERLPVILGCDGAGVVDGVGSAVTRVRPGDAVFFMNGGIGGEPGNYSEFTTVHEEYVAAKPAQLDMVHAAALPLVLITAWEALFERAGLQAGQTVLIHAAAGGVGHVAVQLARNAGARVAVTVSGAEKADLARRLGAEKIIDYRREDFAQAALEWTGGAGVDVVFDTVGGATFCASFAAAKVYGKIVTLLQSECSAADLKLARTRNQSIHYELMLTPMLLGMHAARVAQRKMLEAAAQMVEAGRLEVVVGCTFPLEQAAEAHRLVEAGHLAGKIVLIP
ncbi:MAG: zinc-dependent alcohol dehydrogenase family protein [Sulfuricella sp.]|nr:zinc-dependent alcohol dehydrogenase family protein [Sulfuricella sp.]